MEKKVAIFPLLIIIILITSCGDCKPYQGVENKDKVAIDRTTESRYAFLKNIITTNENWYVEVDYVDYLTGKEALEAEWRDEAFFIDGLDTISNITNGYYISNVNPKIRIFKIDTNASIKNIIDDDGAHKMKPPKSLSIEQLQEYIERNTLLMFHIENGIVKSIDERFMP